MRPRVVLRWRGRQVQAHGRAAAIQGMRDALLFGLQQANLTVPLEEGTLMRSGTVDLDEERGEGTISYDTPYARRQHEEVGWRHDPGRRARWLKLTIDEQEQVLREIAARPIRDALKG